MRDTPKWRRYLRFWGSDPEADADDELDFHMSMRVEELVRRGVPEAEARTRAGREFGDVERVRSQLRSLGHRRRRREERARWRESLSQDLRFALRTLRKNPVFSATAIITLGLGIGANSAIFSVVDGVLLRSLPFAEPDRLVRISTAYPNGRSYALSPPDFTSLRDDSRALAGAAAFAATTVTVLDSGEPHEVEAARVTEGYFGLLGVSPQAGRTFRVEEHRSGGGRAVVLGHEFWRRELGGDRAAIGRMLRLDGETYNVAGVLPTGFAYPPGAEVYLPIEHDETFDGTTARGRREEWLRMVGRMAPGASMAGLEAELRTLGSRLQREFPETNENLSFAAVGLHESVVGPVREPLLILLGAVGLVLLIACANVAHLLLARSGSRESELAVRTALGAGRGRVLRQLLTENVTLGLAGGALGLLLAYWGTRALVAARPESIPRLDEIGIDAGVVAFTLGMSLATGVVFGIIAALQRRSERPAALLRSGGRDTSGGRRGGAMRSGLIVAETALSVMLLIGAGLLGRSFLELTAVDPGFDQERAIAVRVSLPATVYEDAASRRSFFSRLRERLRSIPGVTAVGGASALPLAGGGDVLAFSIEGRERSPDQVWEIRSLSVTPGYFEAMGIPLRRGRLLTEQDRVEAPSVIVINQAAADRWFEGEDPVGRRLLIGEPWEIVGVVDDVKQYGLARGTNPEIYVPHEQWSVEALHMVVRTSGDPLSLGGPIRSEIHALDPELPADRLTTLASIVDESVAQPRFYAILLAIFAVAALLLAGVGLFGVVSYSVSRRTRDIGLRIALGARPEQVLKLVVGRALLLVAGGLGIGALGALVLTRVLRSQLFGVSAGDPLTYGAVAAALAAVALVASYLPARSATRVDPMIALRGE